MFSEGLMNGLPEEMQALVPPGLLDSAKALDKYYIPTRYPNAFAEGAPTDYYTKRDAEDSIDHAKSILSFCQSQIHQPEPDSQAGAGDSGANSGETS